jgi:YD repeat-containing protein
MGFKILLCILIVISLATLPCRAEPPSVSAGPYTVSVESVARILDLTQPAENQACTVLNLSIAGAPAQLDRILEAMQDPAATDNLGGKLSLRQIAFPKAAEARQPATGTAVQVWFSGASAMALSLENFSANLVCYEKRENLKVDFLSVAGEKPSAQTLDNILIAPEVPIIQQSSAGKRYRVKVDITLPQPTSDPASQWINEQMELIDFEGQPQTALSTSRTYQYDANGQVTGRTITAIFPNPAQPPRGIRYRVDHLNGVQTISYAFEKLPLP